MSEIVSLSDDSGAEAKIQVAYGFNCFSFRPMVDGRQRETLWSAPDFAANKTRASGSGNPLLFPFPGRIRGIAFSWKGKDYPLEPGDGRGNAIHGFVHERPWRIVEQSPNSAAGEFHASRDDASLSARWPADFRIRVRYSLDAGALHMHAKIDNPGDSPLPCGFGAHPYFRLPLGDDSRADDCLVQLPVTKKWELVDMLPTGRLTPLANAEDFKRGLAFGDMKFDNVFAGLDFQGAECTSRIIDRAAQRQLSISFDRAFRECVVYNPAHREAICIEPYTCLPGIFSLTESGIDGGLRVLAPGESFEAHMAIRLSSFV